MCGAHVCFACMRSMQASALGESRKGLLRSANTKNNPRKGGNKNRSFDSEDRNHARGCVDEGLSEMVKNSLFLMF